MKVIYNCVTENIDGTKTNCQVMITHGIIKDIRSKLRDSMLRTVPTSNVDYISLPYIKPANMDYVICSSMFDLIHQE